MMLEIKAKTEEGDILFEGTLNRREVSFLLQYAVNDLMAAGVQFNLQEPDPDEDNPAMRIKIPQGQFND